MRKGAAPVPLLIGFGVFLSVMAYLMAASLTRRAAPTFAPAVEARGDTLTVDARDGDRWRYVSLKRGRALSAPDTVDWDVAVRRYHLVAGTAVADLGPALFDTVRSVPGGPLVENPAPGSPVDSREAITDRWYRYSLLTHLLESKRHVYAVRTSGGEYYKLQVLSYYCPGLTAGCMTVRYAPLTPTLGE